MKSKIIQLNSSSDAGGGPQVMWDIVTGLGDSFTFIVVAPGGDFLEKYKKANLPVEAVRAQNFIKIASQIRRVIKRENPSIIHLHGTRAAIWGRLAVIALKDKPKVVYTLHGFHILRKNIILCFILLWVERFLNRWTNVLICVSQADKKLVLKKRAISADRIKVIRNGIEISKFRPDTELVDKTKKELQLENKFVLSAIGRLHPQKDFSTVLKALKLLIDKITNVRLLIIGDGPLRNSLGQEVENLKLTSYVEFLGARKDVPALIQASDIVILSTNWEGLPLVPLEVGASHRPIIASDIESVREAVMDSETGYLFRPGLARDLADKILNLWNSAEKRKEMGENASQYVSDNFSRQRMLAEYKDLFQESENHGFTRG